jgi:hypothetical protein
MTYFIDIRNRIENYLNTISLQLLEEYIGKGKFTRPDLILIQFRHVMHHIGYLHNYLKNMTGKSPEYIGLKAKW